MTAPGACANVTIIFCAFKLRCKAMTISVKRFRLMLLLMILKIVMHLGERVGQLSAVSVENISFSLVHYASIEVSRSLTLCFVQ